MTFSIRYIFLTTALVALSSAAFSRFGFPGLVALAILGFPIFANHALGLFFKKRSDNQLGLVVRLSSVILILFSATLLIFGGWVGAAGGLVASLVLVLFFWLPQFLVVILVNDEIETSHRFSERKKNLPKEIDFSEMDEQATHLDRDQQIRGVQGAGAGTFQEPFTDTRE